MKSAKVILVFFYFAAVTLTCFGKQYSSYPYVSQQEFKALADHIFDESEVAFDPTRVREADVIFVTASPGHLEKFFKQIHPRITSKYILITHGYHSSMPDKYRKFLDDEKIVAWLTKNADYSHTKLFAVPIGLPRRITSDQVGYLNSVAQDSSKSPSKLLYMNFGISSPERQRVRKIFENKSFCTQARNKGWDLYIKEISQFKFVLSPPGGGEDCYRTWEAILVGTVPIVKSSSLDQIYEEFPILIVNNWEEISEEFLERKYKEIKSKSYNFEKLYADYWKGFIRSLQSHKVMEVAKHKDYPYIIGDLFKLIATYVFYDSSSFPSSQVRDGDVIFVRTDCLEDFFSNVHPQVKARYILISHNSDLSPPLHTKRFLDDDKLIAWFAENASFAHPKMHPIPIGLAHQSFSDDKVEIVASMLSKGVDRTKKVKLLYMNLGSTHAQREEVERIFQDKDYCAKASRKEFRDYLEEMSQFKFVLSPRGNGLDCLRTWEAILMGCVPIVKSSPMDRLYEDLPVLIVNDWSEINEKFLIAKYDEIKNKTHKMNKLIIDYWIDEIEHFKQKARN